MATERNKNKKKKKKKKKKKVEVEVEDGAQAKSGEPTHTGDGTSSSTNASTGDHSSSSSSRSDLSLSEDGERVAPSIPHPGTYSVSWETRGGKRVYSASWHDSSGGKVRQVPIPNSRVLVVDHPHTDGTLTSKGSMAIRNSMMASAIVRNYVAADTSRVVPTNLLVRRPPSSTEKQSELTYTWMGTDPLDPISSRTVTDDSPEGRSLLRSRAAYEESIALVSGMDEGGFEAYPGGPGSDGGPPVRTVAIPDGYTPHAAAVSSESDHVVDMVEMLTMRAAMCFGIPKEVLFGASGNRVVSQVAMARITMESSIMSVQKRVSGLMATVVAIYYKDEMTNYLVTSMRGDGAVKKIDSISVQFNNIPDTDMVSVENLLRMGILDEERAAHYALRIHGFKETDVMTGTGSLIENAKKRRAGIAVAPPDGK
jgi:hypothetical protein